jgi:hypothetical protein
MVEKYLIICANFLQYFSDCAVMKTNPIATSEAAKDLWALTEQVIKEKQ